MTARGGSVKDGIEPGKSLIEKKLAGNWRGGSLPNARRFPDAGLQGGGPRSGRRKATKCARRFGLVTAYCNLDGLLRSDIQGYAGVNLIENEGCLAEKCGLIAAPKSAGSHQ